MVFSTGLLIGFLVSLAISTIIIYVITKLFGETEGLSTALGAAFIGALIYGITYYFIGSGLWASVFAGVAWLIALGSLYKMGWLKSFVVAAVIWIGASIVSYVLPTLQGPF